MDPPPDAGDHDDGVVDTSGFGEGPSENGSRAHRVLVVDDHRLFADVISSILTEQGMEVVGVVTSAASAVSEAARSKPDLVLLDLGLPDGNGMDAGRAILKENPDAIVVVVSALAEPEKVREALTAGFRGFVAKDAPLTRFASSVAAALEGQVVMPHDLGERATPSPEEAYATVAAAHLTPRERQVLALLVEGASTSKMATRMRVSRNTVRTHVGRVLAKLQAHSRLEAATFAVRHSLVEDGDALPQATAVADVDSPL